ncbi:hypothetical protein IV203_032291 [Nitzschia inconspicua]|uniref:Uncharacterized protein n=1 Tax=Nitzschia inconspicua TaxID=303405 RepID=A0A9K3KKF8_9STRA|nr:hypothetical protein IV203_032291 [Nitzschia inconspicua]
MKVTNDSDDFFLQSNGVTICCPSFLVPLELSTEKNTQKRDKDGLNDVMLSDAFNPSLSGLVFSIPLTVPAAPTAADGQQIVTPLLCRKKAPLPTRKFVHVTCAAVGDWVGETVGAAVGELVGDAVGPAVGGGVPWLAWAIWTLRMSWMLWGHIW